MKPHKRSAVHICSDFLLLCPIRAKRGSYKAFIRGDPRGLGNASDYLPEYPLPPAHWPFSHGRDISHLSLSDVFSCISAKCNYSWLPSRHRSLFVSYVLSICSRGRGTVSGRSIVSNEPVLSRPPQFFPVFSHSHHNSAYKLDSFCPFWTRLMSPAAHLNSLQCSLPFLSCS